MAGRIIGQDIRTAQDLLGHLDFVKGNQFARAALEITWWVLEAKRQGVPLHVALAARAIASPSGRLRGQDSLDTLMKKIDEAIVRLPTDQAQVPARLGPRHVAAVRSTFRASRSTSIATPRTRLPMSISPHARPRSPRL